MRPCERAPGIARSSRPKLRRSTTEKPMASRSVGDQIVPIVRRFVAGELVT
jgi:hypothetical protein